MQQAGICGNRNRTAKCEMHKIQHDSHFKLKCLVFPEYRDYTHCAHLHGCIVALIKLQELRVNQAEKLLYPEAAHESSKLSEISREQTQLSAHQLSEHQPAATAHVTEQQQQHTSRVSSVRSLGNKLNSVRIYSVSINQQQQHT